MFLVGFVQDNVEFEVFLGTDIDDANESMFNVLELVETYLFVNSLVSLVKLFEELPR